MAEPTYTERSLTNKLTYSIDEACRLTSLHRATIYRAIENGQLRSKLVGRRRLLDARSLHAFVGVHLDD